MIESPAESNSSAGLLFFDDRSARLARMGDLGERAAWWRMALSRAAALCQRPAFLLIEVSSGT